MTRTVSTDQLGGCPGPARIDVWLHRSDGRRSSAVLRHLDGDVVLEVHDVSVLTGIGRDDEWRARADALAGRGQCVRFMHDGLHLLTLGAGTRGHPMRVGLWPPAAQLVGPIDTTLE